MRRSFQEIIELIVFGLIALIVVMLLIWGAGWAFTFVGWLLRLVGGFVWVILKYLIPVAIVAVVVYLLVRLVMNQRDKSPSATTPVAPAPASAVEPSIATPAPEVVADDAALSAEAVDTDIDTSGYKEMDDLAEDIEDDNDKRDS